MSFNTYPHYFKLREYRILINKIACLHSQINHEINHMIKSLRSRFNIIINNSNNNTKNGEEFLHKCIALTKNNWAILRQNGASRIFLDAK